MVGEGLCFGDDESQERWTRPARSVWNSMPVSSALRVGVQKDYGKSRSNPRQRKCHCAWRYINVICFMLVMLREHWRKEKQSVEVQRKEDLDHNPRKRKAQAIEAFADLTFGPSKARNGLVPGRARVEEHGISRSDYSRILERAILRGVFVKRKGKVYRSKQADRALFLEETSDLALKD